MAVLLMRINELRQRYGRAADTAIVDLLQLQEIGLTPGPISTRVLMELWNCDQSTVSRRLAAINRLGPWRVVVGQGRSARHWIEDRPPAPLPPPTPPPASRWEELRRRWWEGVA